MRKPDSVITMKLVPGLQAGLEQLMTETGRRILLLDYG